MNKKVILFRCLALLALVVAIVLEALPFGAALMFAPEPETTYMEYYSYFSFTPFAYANFGPFVTAILTVILTAFALLLLFIKRKSTKLDFTFITITILTVLISIAPIFTGIDCYTITGIFITLALVASAILHAFSLYAVNN